MGRPVPRLQNDIATLLIILRSFGACACENILRQSGNSGHAQCAACLKVRSTGLNWRELAGRTKLSNRHGGSPASITRCALCLVSCPHYIPLSQSRTTAAVRATGEPPSQRRAPAPPYSASGAWGLHWPSRWNHGAVARDRACTLLAMPGPRAAGPRGPLCLSGLSRETY